MCGGSVTRKSRRVNWSHCHEIINKECLKTYSAPYYVPACMQVNFCIDYFYCTVKGIDQTFGEGVKSRLIRSLLINWRLGNFFSSPFKWISSQDQKKTNRRRLIIYKVTLTGQSHFMRIFLTP